MLIERIIKLQLRGLGFPGRTCTPITGYFHEKTKIFKENLRQDYYLHIYSFGKEVDFLYQIIAIYSNHKIWCILGLGLPLKIKW